MKKVPKLRFKEFEKEWEEKKIGDITNLTAGGTPNTLKKEYWNGNIKWMNSGELNLKFIYDVQGRITELGLKNSSTKLIPEKCILIGLAGQGKTRGTVAINFIELCTNQSIASIFPNFNYFKPMFLYYNLDNRYEELRNLSTGSNGRGGLNLNILKRISVFFPILKEQEKIAV
ncbi:restriction endonuclease subunit S [Fusobacterium perfoetens]|uniref:restriction endonuclease subunit S n=1 Tax=Fusobacterium perfoetens TaxID=852 RepID=UPI001F418DAE|nr:restriction endonuclease subunit S [Fusobacterium perfoetens]MCF2612819.1 restriction endonuclease subunit S [Fusobacterium perfoetens]